MIVFFFIFVENIFFLGLVFIVFLSIWWFVYFIVGRFLGFLRWFFKVFWNRGVESDMVRLFVCRVGGLYILFIFIKE